MPRNVTIASRARMLPRGEDAVVREQQNLLTLKMGEICDMLDADAGVTATNFAATIADAPSAPSLVGSIGAQYVGAVVGAAVALAFLSAPSAVNEDATLAAFQVEARTAAGARATDFADSISLSLQSVTYVSATVRDVVLRASAPGLPSVDSGTLRVTLV